MGAKRYVLAVILAKDARQQLVRRVAALGPELKRLDGILALTSFLPRIFVLEMELLSANCTTELKWVRSVVEDLRSAN